MLLINEDNRIEIENQFLSLILNKNDVLDMTQVLPKYLKEKENAKLLEYCIECWKEYKVINPVKILEKHKDFNKDKFLYLLTDVFYYEQAWKQQLKLAEESIINSYKQDIIKNLNQKLENKEIDYSKFIKDIKALDEIKLNSTGNNNMLSIDDIDISTEEQYEYVKSNTIKLDTATKGFALGQLSVWSGGNASAKSTYLNQVALESINQGYNVAIYSGELVARRLLKWLVMQSAGRTNMAYNKEKDFYYVKPFAKDKILKWLQNKLFIYDNNCGNKAQEILSSIQESIEKNNVKIIILDNLMSMNLSNYGENKYDVQSQFVQDLSELAKKFAVHIHFVCHPRKSTSFLRKVDISGSADLTNIADNVFIAHRVNQDFRTKTKELYRWNDNNEVYEFTNVIEICKNRDFGVEDYFVGMFFEKESKRLLNTQNEIKQYGWEQLNDNK